MTCTHQLDWHGHRLTLTRDESEPEPQTGPALPPAPGAGEIAFPAMFLFSDGETVHLETEVCGKKIARIFLEVLWEIEDGWLAGPVCQEELKAPKSKEIGGVEITMWEETNLLSAIWKPAMSLLVSGDHAAWGFVHPAQSNPQESWLHAMRISGGKEQHVRLHFAVDGTLQRMAAVESGSRGLLPQPGDQLIPAVTWLRRESGSWHTAFGSSNVIIVTNQPLLLQEIPAPPGRYHVGLLIRDLDGQPHRTSIAFENPAGGLIFHPVPQNLV